MKLMIGVSTCSKDYVIKVLLGRHPFPREKKSGVSFVFYGLVSGTILLTYEGCVMLDAVMDVDMREVEAPRVVGTVEDPGDVARRVERERGRKVVG
jgi:hypothetical protein